MSMQAKRTSSVTVEMTEQEAFNLAGSLSEALFYLAQPQADGYPVNWRSDPGDLKRLYTTIKPAGWSDIP